MAGEGTPLETALGSPAVEAAVFGGGDDAGVAVGVSPFLAFATAVHRMAVALETATFVEERWAPRVRIPVFDTAALRALLSDPARRYFLVELLTSYTRVSSGVTWTRTARGWRRRRFSELDPSRLAELLEVVAAPSGRASTGASATWPGSSSGCSSTTRRRSGPAPPPTACCGCRGSGATRRRWRRPVTATLAVADHMADHFDEGRRVLNAVADRYLFPWREVWFGAG